MKFDQSLSMLNYAEEEIFNSLNAEIRDLISQKITPVNLSITKHVLSVFTFCKPNNVNQKVMASLLDLPSNEFKSSLQKVLEIAHKGFLELFFNFAKSKKREYHSPAVIQEIVRLFYSLIHSHVDAFSTLALPSFEEGGKEVVLGFKASQRAPSQELLNSELIYNVMKRTLYDTHSSFKEKQIAVLNYFKLFPERNTLNMEAYLYFFEALQNKYHKQFQNEEKIELIKLIFDLTSNGCHSVIEKYTVEDIDEFLKNVWNFKQCCGSEGLLLFCTPLNSASGVSFKDVIRAFKLLVSCKESLDVIEILERFSSHTYSFIQFLEILEKKFDSLTFVDSHLDSEDIELPLNRFLTDPDVSFSINIDTLSVMREYYYQVRELCNQYRNLTLNELIEKGSSLRQKALEQPLESSEFLELIAIGRLAIKMQFDIYPDRTQILTVLGLLVDGKNRLAQVKTGEGKSIIVTLMAFIMGMQNRAVDIITSAAYLAQRDHDRFKNFFLRFGISTSHICHKNQRTTHFSGQILYGTVTDFEFAFMRDRLNSVGLYEERSKYVQRNFDCVIIDEVDNLLIDTAINNARLSYPAEESCHWVYAPILKFIKIHFRSLLTCPLPSPSILSELREFIRQDFDSMNDKRFMNFSDKELSGWLRSAYKALFEMEENVDYVVKKIKDDNGKWFDSIQIVDAQNTGRIVKSSRWAGGLHEFIEVKHDIDVGNETLVPISLSHASFYSFYRLILGLSGTLGLLQEREEIHEIYDIECFDVPPHSPSLRLDLNPKISHSDSIYFQEILQSILTFQSQGRPVLVLCSTIDDSEELAHYLNKYHVKFQLLNEMQNEHDSIIISKAGGAGVITVATNTASRGTDIQLSDASLINGGLHVILTFFPELQRVCFQMIGRSGRRGQPGSSEMILSRERGMLKEYYLLELSDEEILKELENKRQHHASYMRHLRIQQSKFENINFSYAQIFFDYFKQWKFAITQESFLNHHSKRLSKLRLSKSREIRTEHLFLEEKMIADECLILLRAPRGEKIDRIRWKALLGLIIELLSKKIIRAWSQNFYQDVQNSIYSSSEETLNEYKNRLRVKFSNHKDSWEKYMQMSGEGIFTLLNELSGINLIERSLT